VRAYKEDASKGNKEAEVPEHKQVQKHEGTGMMRTDPYMRFGRLPSMFQELQREMDALTRGFGLWDDDIFRSPMLDLEPFRKPLAAAAELPTMRLVTDVEETDKDYIIKADVPGMSRGDIKLQLLDNMLTISGERKEERREEANEQKPGVYERRYGKFVRSFTLPNNVKTEGITASCKDGVLSVVLPKAEEEIPKPKEIAIE
jgi:HSP20 family protein